MASFDSTDYRKIGRRLPKGTRIMLQNIAFPGAGSRGLTIYSDGTYRWTARDDADHILETGYTRTTTYTSNLTLDIGNVHFDSGYVQPTYNPYKPCRQSHHQTAHTTITPPNVQAYLQYWLVYPTSWGSAMAQDILDDIDKGGHLESIFPKRPTGSPIYLNHLYQSDLIYTPRYRGKARARGK